MGGGVIFQQQTLFLLVRKNIKKTITLVVTCTVDAIKISLMTEMIQCLTGSAVLFVPSGMMSPTGL